MNQDLVTQILYQGVIVCLLVSMPAIGIGLLVGFTISLFQAVTQIQEQTLTFVPKVIAVLLMIVFTSPWIVSMLTDFTITLWSSIPNMVQ
ncbi:flagellar biosynthetic protein FliQ [candidate division WOR-1 bacterium RIFOXYA12_FULL_52_29]|uniref:Flagellar biosynthetic protein FliQ n=1 Tax=candidate division WOR-1 bacterium RIFOXYC12_FULL_54_18 TaxID=1802584 RepID=A0A1F4T536_UNCSA|nr:MAG: flagellar biosynthetic protein FliQ [candidate division WOR-1 bacterium RIFOXYA2_FULL_51_19]OGC17240.1 MAG: flagellar biosynthetic protein FliQ [candidate division WOR-1 bacterium RIFOXYA12_FULL_52_29]OGC26100.1 MAG: flagellar biosynthetic protein FliQ [candidate division WOR-1 bacterium RIFOXYB2_FULL_45_9]OGC27657.1 MAG: flagellar biosynthetic protein FliQ [candidate division WOR-1 bacterium RIFOXYC12_FULL_54_18]OGC29129.1 MAG: flagellar biosynthetic protein FliQ [candidate division WO